MAKVTLGVEDDPRPPCPISSRPIGRIERIGNSVCSIVDQHIDRPQCLFHSVKQSWRDIRIRKVELSRRDPSAGCAELAQHDVRRVGVAGTVEHVTGRGRGCGGCRRDAICLGGLTQIGQEDVGSLSGKSLSDGGANAEWTIGSCNQDDLACQAWIDHAASLMLPVPRIQTRLRANRFNACQPVSGVSASVHLAWKATLGAQSVFGRPLSVMQNAVKHLDFRQRRPWQPRSFASGSG